MACYFTIITPTYNRGYLLKRPFDSLKSQQFKDFKWIIVDDGSTDDTTDVVNKLKQDADFPIQYIKLSQNTGKMAAVLEAYKFVESLYVVNLDSDDELLPETLKRFYEIWESVSPKDYERIWAVAGRCADSQNGNMLGKPFPNNINELKGIKQLKRIINAKKGGGANAECLYCKKISVLRKYSIPKYVDTNFVIESSIWHRIYQDYDMYCTNEIFRIYYTNVQDALTKKSRNSLNSINARYHWCITLVNHCLKQFSFNPDIKRAVFYLDCFAILSNRNLLTVVNEINSWIMKFIATCLWLPSLFFCKIYYKRMLSK